MNRIARDIMANKKQPNQPSFFTRHRLLSLMLILFLVVLPLVFIPSVYIYKFSTKNPVLFETKGVKLVKPEDSIFNTEFILSEIKMPNEDNLKGAYVFKYKLNPKETVNTITNVKYQFQLSVINDKYTTYSQQNLTAVPKENYSTTSIEFNYNMDKFILPFISAKGPNLYIKITYDEVLLELGTTKTHTIYMRLDYDDSTTKVTLQ